MPVVAALRVAGQEPAHFEARQVRPVALTPDGTRLLVLHGADAKLSVFDVAGEAAVRPVLTAELQTGLEPVSVMARTDDEVWVVNEASDSVSVISLKRMTTVATLACGDEPGDVVFAGGRAWVSCGRSNEVWVYDAASRAMVSRVALPGLYPRSLAVKADGSGVYAASLLSGNGTTVLPAAQAGGQPMPTNVSLPAAPATARIVRADDARAAGDGSASGATVSLCGEQSGGQRVGGGHGDWGGGARAECGDASSVECGGAGGTGVSV